MEKTIYLKEGLVVFVKDHCFLSSYLFHVFFFFFFLYIKTSNVEIGADSKRLPFGWQVFREETSSLIS